MPPAAAPTPGPTPPRPRPGKKLLLLTGALLLALLAAEGLLRLFTGARYLALEPTLQSGEFTYRPGQSCRYRYLDEIDTEIRINARGFRDTDEVVPPGAKTAVALGDSFTEGSGVDLAQTYVKQLQELLKPGPSGIAHVYNAGHFATDPKHYAAVYRRFFAENASVTLVTLGFFLRNDVVTPAGADALQPPVRNLRYRVKVFLVEHSALYNLCRRTVSRTLLFQRALSRIGLMAPPDLGSLRRDPKARADWDYTADFLDRFYRDEIQRRGRRFLLVLIPPKELVDDAYFAELLRVTGTAETDVDRYGLRDFLVASCRARGIPCVDLTAVFRAKSDRAARDFYFPTDAHWNPAGHRLAAEAIHQALIERRMLE